jgi:hypothetical protein
MGRSQKGQFSFSTADLVSAWFGKCRCKKPHGWNVSYQKSQFKLESCGIDFLTSVEIGIGFLLKCRFSVGISFGFRDSKKFFSVFSKNFFFSGMLLYSFC